MRTLSMRLHGLCTCLAIGICIFSTVSPELASGDDCELMPDARASDDHSILTDAQTGNRHSAYCLKDIGTLPGNDYSFATGINNQGEIIGDSGSSSFLYRNGSLLRIEPLPGDDSSSVFSMNDLGMAVGSSAKIGYSTETRPFVYSRGEIRPISGIDDGIAYGINKSGQIVGAARGFGPFFYGEGRMVSLGKEGGAAYGINNKGHVVGRTDTDRAFMYRDGKMTELGTLPGHSYSSAQAINDKGQVVGISAPTGMSDARAFLYPSNGEMVGLGTLESDDLYSVATDINESGVIVGFSGINTDFYATSGLRAFIYADGKMTDLNTLVYQCFEMTLTAATSTNDRGEIVGRGSRHNRLHAFVLRPRQKNEPCQRGRGNGTGNERQE
jgi:probable HAF family extracellular repeat protein